MPAENLIVSRVHIEELVEMCQGTTQLFLLPRPDFLFDRKVNRSRKQDVHTLNCMVKNCENTCKYVHPICEEHAKFFHLELNTSTITTAGKGLFLSKSVREGTHIMNYTGIYRNNDELVEEYDSCDSRSYYKINVYDDYAIDARSTVCGLGRYINHHPDDDKTNVAFEYDEDNDLYRLVTTKEIRVPKNGKVELFINYGDSYWNDEEPDYPPEPSQEYYDDLSEEAIEPFIEPDEFPVFPSYATVMCMARDDFPRSISLPLNEIVTRARDELLLFPIPAPQLMDPYYLDMTKKQNVVEMDCIVKDCKTICTYTHPLCRKHLKEGFHIEVKTSNVTNGGRGVFLHRSVKEGTVLMLFTGCFRKSDNLYDHYQENDADFFYLFEGPKRHAIDSRSTASGIGRYVNHQPEKLSNVTIQASAGENFFKVVAKRDILVPKGSAVELFADYGDAYWAHRKQHNIDEETIRESEAGDITLAEPFEEAFAVVPAYASVE